MKKVPIYSLTISLNFWSPKIWRRIWVRGDTKLDYLSWILFISMGWFGCHLSEIIAQGKHYGNRDIDPPDYLLDWTKYTLQDITKNKSSQFKFLYDFGDSWKMTVKVKELEEYAQDARYPVCVNGENAPPPEDVGSYVGFERFIAIMNNKKHPEYDEISAWWGENRSK